MNTSGCTIQNVYIFIDGTKIKFGILFFQIGPFGFASQIIGSHLVLKNKNKLSLNCQNNQKS